jgi:uncharacterized membrane protein required for colicin V production
MVTLLDGAFIGLILYCSVMGLRRGVVHETTSFIPVLGSVVIPFFVIKKIVIAMKGFIHKTLLWPVSFMVAAIVSFILLKILLIFLRWLFQKIPLLQPMIGPMGGLVGFLKACCYCVILIMLLELSPFSNQSWVKKSHAHQFVGKKEQLWIKQYVFKQWMTKKMLIL